MVGPQPKVVSMHQMNFSFNFGDAQEYMTKYFALDEARAALNKEFNALRQEAREHSVPTKAIEAAVRAAKGRKSSALSSKEFEGLMDEAERLLKALDTP